MMDSGRHFRLYQLRWAALALVTLPAMGCIPRGFHATVLTDAEIIRPPLVRVLLPIEGARFEIRSDARCVIRTTKHGRDLETYSTADPVTVTLDDKRFRVKSADGATLAESAEGVSVHPADSTSRIWINNTPYFGTIVLGAKPDGSAMVINRLNLDHYLTGVLTPELGERQPDEFEAVKAQAVASRTYALAHLGQYPNASYDLRADVSDQIYVGASQRRDWVDRAVFATTGEVLTAGGHMIEAYYHSTCGGFTDAIEDIWPKKARAYLKSVNDDTACNWSKYTSWEEVFDQATLLAALRAYRDRLDMPPVGDFSRVLDIRFEEETPGGRHRRMIVTTGSGRFTVDSDQIRWALGRPSRPGTILPSSRFELELEHGEDGSIVRAVARGSGYGHGVGMCQCGMIGRARAGWQYRDILTHYYTGAQVERLY